MNIPSHYLPLEKVSAGMVLAADILDHQGHVLLPQGSELSDATIRSLARHEIHQLCIVSEAVSAEHMAQLTARQLERLQHLFRHCPASGATAQLKRYLQSYREEQLK